MKEKLCRALGTRTEVPAGELQAARCSMVLLDFVAVAERIGRRPDRSARLFLWRQVKAGRFPAPLQLSPSRIAWDAAAVEEWLKSRPVVRYAPKAEGRDAS